MFGPNVLSHRNRYTKLASATLMIESLDFRGNLMRGRGRGKPGNKDGGRDILVGKWWKELIERMKEQHVRNRVLPSVFGAAIGPVPRILYSQDYFVFRKSN